MSERDALLEPSISSHSHSHENSSCLSCEASTCSGSDYEWEDSVLENGHLFYIDSFPLNQKNASTSACKSTSFSSPNNHNQDDNHDDKMKNVITIQFMYILKIMHFNQLSFIRKKINLPHPEFLKFKSLVSFNSLKRII